MATTRFELVTPSANMYSGEAEMIVCQSVDGEIAFLADHMPYIGALDPCLVRIVGPEGAAGLVGAEASAGEIRVAVHGGFVEVKSNQVIMLADIAMRPEEIDVAAAERDGAEASQRTDSATEDDRSAVRDLKWAHARLEAART